MAKTAMILGPSGDGKSSSFIVNLDGTINFEAYQGMNPEETVIFNCDGNELPFPYERLGWREGVNLFSSTFDSPLTAESLETNIVNISNNAPQIKAIIVDSLNGAMNDKEMLETRNMTYDKWFDFAKDFYRLIMRSNGLRNDLIIYFCGHIHVFTDTYGNESRALVTNGKKLEKIHLETKVNIVIHTNVELGAQGTNSYRFETQKNKSTGKTPYGMFGDFLVPNSLKLVDNKIRDYYSINV